MFLYGGWVSIEANVYTCLLCYRQFDGEQAIVRHCLEARYHWWCDICYQLFDTEMARRFHVMDSPNHHTCAFCIYQTWFHNQHDRDRHWKQVHFRCAPCQLNLESQVNLDHHNLLYHCGCHICFRPFESFSAREAHLRSHAPHRHDCRRCRRTFHHFSHYLAHIETSRCGSGERIIEVLNTAHDVGQVLNHPGCRERFHCPGCLRGYTTLSQVYAHVETFQQCQQQLASGNFLHSLRHFLRQRI